MKSANISFALSAALLLSCLDAWASDVTIPNTFSAGSPAVAAEVNANFSAVKNAVDDNNARISAVETKLTGGSVSIHGSEFRLNSTDSTSCRTYYSANSLRVSNGTNCPNTNVAWLFAPLHLPDGVTITGLKCSVYDSSTGGVSAGMIYVKPFGDVAATSYANLPASTTIGYEMLSSSLVSIQVDNSSNAYVIELVLTNGGTDFLYLAGTLSIIGCSVSYSS